MTTPKRAKEMMTEHRETGSLMRRIALIDYRANLVLFQCEHCKDVAAKTGPVAYCYKCGAED